MIFYEAPHKLKKTLSDLLLTFGDRKLSLCRELTKIHEEVFRTTISGAIEKYEVIEPKGEFVLVLEGKSEEDTPFWESMSIKEHFAHYAENLSDADAMKAVAKDRGISKSEVYKEIKVK